MEIMFLFGFSNKLSLLIRILISFFLYFRFSYKVGDPTMPRTRPEIASQQPTISNKGVGKRAAPETNVARFRVEATGATVTEDSAKSLLEKYVNSLRKSFVFVSKKKQRKTQR